jgi:hypothetical protein
VSSAIVRISGSLTHSVLSGLTRSASIEHRARAQLHDGLCETCSANGSSSSSHPPSVLSQTKQVTRSDLRVLSGVNKKPALASVSGVALKNDECGQAFDLDFAKVLRRASRVRCELDVGAVRGIVRTR